MRKTNSLNSDFENLLILFRLTLRQIVSLKNVKKNFMEKGKNNSRVHTKTTCLNNFAVKSDSTKTKMNWNIRYLKSINFLWICKTLQNLLLNEILSCVIRLNKLIFCLHRNHSLFYWIFPSNQYYLSMKFRFFFASVTFSVKFKVMRCSRCQRYDCICGEGDFPIPAVHRRSSGSISNQNSYRNL